MPHGGRLRSPGLCRKNRCDAGVRSFRVRLKTPKVSNSTDSLAGVWIARVEIEQARKFANL